MHWRAPFLQGMWTRAPLMGSTPILLYYALVAEMVDAPYSKYGIFGCEGSTPSLSTKKGTLMAIKGFYFYVDIYLLNYVYKLQINVPSDDTVNVSMLHRPFVVAFGAYTDFGLVIDRK